MTYNNNQIKEYHDRENLPVTMASSAYFAALVGMCVAIGVYNLPDTTAFIFWAVGVFPIAVAVVVGIITSNSMKEKYAQIERDRLAQNQDQKDNP